MTTYFGFAIADGMFPAACTISRQALTTDDARQEIANGVVSMLNPFHTSTIKAMNTRLDLHVEIPGEAIKVNLQPGDRVIVMSVRGLPRLTESREYTDEEIASSDFAFGLWTVEEQVPSMDGIIALAAQLPSGLGDDKAAEKLLREREELLEAIADNDYAGALTELADAVYYAAKHIQYAAALLNLAVDDAIRLARAKYTLRARPGNPKDDQAEREACLSVVKPR